MAYSTASEGIETGWDAEATVKRAAPVNLQMQELEMQGDRLEKMVAIVSERLGLVLTPERPQEAKTEGNPGDGAEMSALARKLQRQVVRFSQLARRLEDLNSRLEL